MTIHGQITSAQLEDWFIYHKPTDEQRAKYHEIRKAAHSLAGVIVTQCPPGPDTTAAIRKLREAVMTANASIACNGGIVAPKE